MDLYYLFRPTDLKKTLEDLMMSRAAFPAPSAPATVGAGAGMTTIHICLHVPARRPMVELADLLTGLADRLGGTWDYRYSLEDGRGAFHIRALPVAEETAP